ncbi:YbaB/EbfC family nucleoid-associated protein [Prochlorococcus sp. MIT 1223]|uniref:YbaB/EbfC family nucleoid-associated protein n=1 Tax=Prochlorococcus sp. MIT 1223 TaxID=3096217 RepID=UPI002A757AEE|nr:YbaB/EbfC family nucleoid-associated protein [Prochlorococcus sp. MIT 1223]
MAGFGLPNFGQLTDAFRKAQQIQQNAQKLQEELEVMEVEGKSADGRTSVWLSGNQLPLKVRIDPTVLAEGKEVTESSFLDALKSAHEISTTTMKERMEELTGGLKLNLPGLNSEDQE